MKKISIYAVAFFLSHTVSAQQTLQLGESSSANATIEEVSWIAGDWEGEAFGGTFEESWNPPSGHSMLGMFKQINNGEINFYEILTISEEKESLVIRLKHFDKQLNGWEEKNEKLEAWLVNLEDDAVYFEGYSFFRLGPDKIKCVVLVEDEEIEFLFNRKR